MDTKDITAVLLKVAGLVMFCYAIFSLPYYFLPYQEAYVSVSFVTALAQAAATLTLPIVLGLLLWFSPATVTNKIVSGEKLSGAQFRIRELEHVAFTVLGAWLVAYGLTDLIYSLMTEFVLREHFPQEALSMRVYPGAVAAGAKILIGVGLAVGARRIARLFARMRDEG